jgi:hypothetical protein
VDESRLAAAALDSDIEDVDGRVGGPIALTEDSDAMLRDPRCRSSS